jgi:3-phosphoshikimate 1-carboxyvinyltransferase
LHSFFLTALAAIYPLQFAGAFVCVQSVFHPWLNKMPLPDLIEIVPLDKPVRAEITVPGSKSITNRALILAALAEGEVTLEGALWSEDTQIMVECLQELGFMVDVRPDPNEFCNRTITVYGKGGVVPPGGTEQQPMELFVGNAGTAARFLAAFVCLGKGVYRLHGVLRMSERPKASLFQALRELGYRVESPTNKLPAVIYGNGPKLSAKCTVNIEESSQFASALLLCAKVGGWHVEVIGEDAEESPYVTMTSKLIGAFPNRGGKFQIEPDASSGSYFWGAGWLFPIQRNPSDLKNFADMFGYKEAYLKPLFESQSFASVFVANWPASRWQIDQAFPSIIPLSPFVDHSIPVSRNELLGDSIMTAIVLAPFAIESCKFTDLGRLRLQETERVIALRTELTKCGAKVIEAGDTLTVYPSQLHGAEIETYNDHRMAMCFAILGLKVPGIKIKNPACVKKTFPNFFQKLAAPPPHGLGATILDANTGRKLAHEELFAD